MSEFSSLCIGQSAKVIANNFVVFIVTGCTTRCSIEAKQDSKKAESDEQLHNYYMLHTYLTLMHGDTSAAEVRTHKTSLISSPTEVLFILLP